MKGWNRISQYALEHESGNYRISKAMVNGGWFYTVWRKNGRDWDRLETGREAEKLIEKLGGPIDG